MRSLFSFVMTMGMYYNVDHYSTVKQRYYSRKVNGAKAEGLFEKGVKCKNPTRSHAFPSGRRRLHGNTPQQPCCAIYSQPDPNCCRPILRLRSLWALWQSSSEPDLRSCPR